MASGGVKKRVSKRPSFPERCKNPHGRERRKIALPGEKCERRESFPGDRKKDPELSIRRREAIQRTLNEQGTRRSVILLRKEQS